MAELRCSRFPVYCRPKQFPSFQLGRSKRLRVRMAQETKDSCVPTVSSSGLTEYRDSLLDLAFIDGCRKAFGRVAGWQSPKGWDEGYLGMVEVSHALMRGRSAAEQQAAVLQGFPRVPEWFRKLFPYSDWGAELNARITPLFFQWLVGPCEVSEVEIGDKTMKSEVKIKKCRYLETSGCTAMCVNLCKVPTQYFFTSELGMPLYMEPNFEDLSCRMVFGQSPPPLAEDPVSRQGCLSSCPSSSKAVPCPKLK
ncbi:hypothetical protein R1sor_021769 [Riccia sorocarpa]|uniref:Beta-carotene isomerase D27-like C-terminal domain-containing protein n=1 Tax=Riccia sorocarpa TaxID=122646 RepID=A0ABD3GI07_9MARC